MALSVLLGVRGVGSLAGEVRSRCGNLCVNLVGDVSALIDVRDESGYHGHHKDECDESPSDLFEHVSCLTHSEGLVSGREVACKSASLAVLEKDNDCEQDACKDYKHCQDYE